MRLSIAFALPLTLAAFAAQAPAQPTFADAQRLYERTDYQSALAILQKLPPQNGAVRELTGRCRFFLGDYKAAIDELGKAVQIEPRSSDHYMWLGRAWGRRAETSNWMFAMKYAPEARRNLEKAVQLNSANLEAVNDLLSFYLDAPGFMGGGMEQATKLTELIRQRDPAEYEWALAQLSIHRKDYTSAERQLRKAAELEPRHVNRLVDLAKFVASRGRLKESEALFDQAAGIDPHNKGLLYGRAETWIKGKRNLATAKKYLEGYLQAPLTPDDPSREEARKLMQRASAGGGEGD